MLVVLQTHKDLEQTLEQLKEQLLTHIGITNSYGAYAQATSSVIQDVQDVTQDKVRFCVSAITPSATTLQGDGSGRAATHVTFIRLGDT